MVSRWTLGQFYCDEDGSTAFALIWFVVLAMVAGIGLDTTNAWYVQSVLQRTSDVAAHAGVVALSEGADDEEVRARVEAQIAANLDEGSFGPVISDRASNIQILSYDGEKFDPVEGKRVRNAVSVSLHRDKSTQNPVNLFLLQMAGTFSGAGIGPWNISTSSVALRASAHNCSTSDKIHAFGQIEMSANQFFGSGYCVLSQDRVWMPSNNTFERGAVVGMPDLKKCQNKCTNSANPGAGDAAREMNVPLGDVSGFIEALGVELLQGAGYRHYTLFSGVQVGSAISALVDLGVASNNARAGDTIGLSASDFNQLPAVPSGLVYHVSCSGQFPDRINGSQGGGNGNGGGKDKGKNNGGGNGGKLNATSITMNLPLNRAALVTDCNIDLGRDAAMIGSTIVMTSSSAILSAGSHASVGAPTGNCQPRDRTTIATQGGLKVPAAFATSNLGIVAVGDIHLAGGSPARDGHYGLSLTTLGKIHISAGHTFYPCGLETSFEPRQRLIRMAMP